MPIMNSASTDNQELILAGDSPTLRAPPCSLDDQYIKQYTQNPAAGKTAALKACGFKGVNPTSRAHDLHKRLQRRIDAELADCMAENIFIGATGLRELAINAEQESVKAAACVKLIEFGIKYKPKDDDQINGHEAMNEINAQIEQVEQRIKTQQSGDPI